MARAHSHVKKRRRGCLSGCLVKIVLLLGAAALLFVAACSVGVIQNDPETGAPYVTLEGLGFAGLSLPELSGMEMPSLAGLNLPAWAYRVNPSGLTVKTLLAGDGEAVLVCSDGYTMLLGAGEGKGLLLAGQLLLSGVNHLHAAVAMQSSDVQLGGMATAIKLMKPDYLLYPDTQVKSGAYNAMLSAAEKQNVQLIAPQQGLSFSLGRATVTVIGPRLKRHTDERDDGLSVRIDYGDTSVLVMGGVTAAGERDMVSSAHVDVDVLIASCGGAADGTCAEFAEAVSPQIALLTGKVPANPVKVRLERVGAQVYTAQENGVMTVFSDGQTVSVQP